MRGLALLALLVQAGCAHLPSPPTDAAHGRAGTVGIVHATFRPEVVVELPAKGRVDGAVRGAGRGFLAWAETPLRVGAEMMRNCNNKECGYVAVGVLAICAAAGTVGAVVGGVHGAVHAIPEAEAREIESGASRHLADLRIQETMWARVLDVAADHTGYAVVPLPSGGPGAPDCVVAYGPLESPAAGGLVEVSVLSVGFRGTRWGSNPPLSVFLRVRVRRYRTQGGVPELEREREFRYESDERSFAEWMADGAARTEADFLKGYAMLGREIADWI